MENILWKTIWRFLKKLKIELPYDPAIPLLSIYPKTTKNICPHNTYTLVDKCSHQSKSGNHPNVHKFING